MNKQLVIHIVSETVVLLMTVLYLRRSIQGLQNEIKVLKQRLDQQDAFNSRLASHIQQLYHSSAPGPRMMTSHPPPIPSSPNLHASHAVNAPHHSSTPPPPASNMMETILTIIPSMFPVMSTSSSSMILKELEKPAPKVEIVNEDEEEDPDVQEALKA